MGRASRAKRTRRETGVDPRRRRHPLRPLNRPLGTRWNGQPCEARQCVVVVADSDAPSYWARGYVGQLRRAVEVKYEGQVFYLDDEGHPNSDEHRELVKRYAEGLSKGSDGRISYEQALAKFGGDRAFVGGIGWGWAKVTVGHGSPSYGHSELAIERVEHYIEVAEAA